MTFEKSNEKVQQEDATNRKALNQASASSWAIGQAS
jgi:hypothetical protein